MKPYFPRRKEQNQVKGRFAPRIPKSKKEESEFASGKKDILVCKKCHAVYWYKSWHHRLEDYPRLKQSKRVKFVLCPACQMILDRKYEGEIVLKNVPAVFREDIKTLAKNYGKRAEEIDPMDRIISLQEIRAQKETARREEKRKVPASKRGFDNLKDIRILTTENQLALRLAKKISQVFRGRLSSSISHSHQEDTVRIEISFK